MFKSEKDNVPVSIPREAVCRLVGHDGPIPTVCMSNSKYCWTGGYDRTVRLWNPCRLDPAFPPPSSAHHNTSRPRGGGGFGQPFNSLPRALPIQTYSAGITHPVTCLSVNHTTDCLLVGSAKTVVVMDVLTQQCKRRLQGHLGQINSVTMSDELYLSASYDATVRIWDARVSHATTAIQTLEDAKDSVTGVHVLPHQAMIRTSSVDGILRTYDLRKGQLLCDDTIAASTALAVSNDTKIVAVNGLDGNLRLLESETGQLVQTCTGSHKAGQYGLQCCFTSDNSTIVTGSEDGACVLYDALKGHMIQRLEGHTKPTCSVAVFPVVTEHKSQKLQRYQDYHRKEIESSILITASYDGNAIVWANDHSMLQPD